MAHVNDTRYTYAVSRVRAVEKKLLDKVKLERMVDARTPEETMKILLEADYGFGASEQTDIFEYEKLLMEENKKVYAFLKEISPEPEFFNPFLLFNDCHNIKVLLKSEFSDQESFDSLLMESGTLTIHELKSMVKDRKFYRLPSNIIHSVQEALDSFNRSGNPQMIDLVLDKASFEQMREAAIKTQNGFLLDFVSARIDLTNIRTVLRIKKLKKSWDLLQKSLIAGGRIEPKIFTTNLEVPLDSLIEALRFTPYISFLEKGMESFKGTGSLTELEKLSDNYMVDFVKQARYISFGVEPLIGYLVAKEMEIKNVRIIIVGKVNQIPSEIIRERLRDTYV